MSIVPYTKYHKDGTIYAKGQNLDDLMHGYWEFYRKDGSKMRSGSFEKGVQVGEWVTYDKNGDKVKTTVFKAEYHGEINPDIISYNQLLEPLDKSICELLCDTINANLANSSNKVWHGHPVWFIDGNPIVGYSKRKNSIDLMFWSGQSFEDDVLTNVGSFKAAQIKFTKLDEVIVRDIIKLLKKSVLIQWDYKNIVKRKGELTRLK